MSVSPHALSEQGTSGATPRCRRGLPLCASLSQGIDQQLGRRLDERGVDFRLIAGRPGPRDVARRDAVVIPWARTIENRYLPIGHRELCWQPCLRAVWEADIVIVEQASRLLANYVLLAGRRWGGPRVAMWGHGENIQPHRSSRWGESVKRLVSRRVDWWFAYNATSAAVIDSLGFPEERVTVVQNAIDTRSIQEVRRTLTPQDLDDARRRLGVAGQHAGVFSGSLYPDKRLRFLVAAADRVRAAVPDFELLVIGDGVDASFLRDASRSRPWLHAPGALYGREKALALSLGQASLVPGLVGLGILDGFALGLPLVTTRVPFHSHEIEYLREGENGLMVDDWQDPSDYATAVIALMTDDVLRRRLQAGCAEAAKLYTVETMSENFANGVCDAITAPRRRAGMGR